MPSRNAVDPSKNESCASNTQSKTSLDSFFRGLYHLVPASEADDPDKSDSSQSESADEERTNSAWVDVDDKEWTDEQLMDASRQGRRKQDNEMELNIRSMAKEADRMGREGVNGGKEFDLKPDSDDE